MPAIRHASRPIALVLLVACSPSDGGPSDEAPSSSTAPAGIGTSAKVEEELPFVVRNALERADPVRLLSLDPFPESFDPKAWKTRGYERLETFHDYAVLGATDLEGEARRAVVRALYDGIDASDGRVAACFSPRHGLSAALGAAPPVAVDVVICFECLSMQVFVDGEHAANVLTAESPRETFAAALRSADVRLPDR